MMIIIKLVSLEITKLVEFHKDMEHIS